MTIVNVTIHDSSKDEERVAAAVRDVLKTYRIPMETSEIVIEKGAVPHSHPTLTLNARTVEPLSLLELLTHEQLHWYFDKQDKVTQSKVISTLKHKYPNSKSHQGTLGDNPDDFWVHLVVIWNTLNCLRQQLSEEEIDALFSGWRPYPQAERFVKDHFQELQSDLASLSMVYEVAKMRCIDENR